MSNPIPMDVDPSSSTGGVNPLVDESTSQTPAIPAGPSSAHKELISLSTQSIVPGSGSMASGSTVPPPNGQPTPGTDMIATVNPGATLLSLDDTTETDAVVRMVRTGYVFDPLMMLHAQDGYEPTRDDVIDAGEGHPEEPMRIKRIMTKLKQNGLIRRMKQIPSQEATYDQVVLVHGQEHWNKVQGTEAFTDEYIQETKHYYDTMSLYVCRQTAHCARLSCGGVIAACEAVCTGQVRNAFAIVRPPGHHAEPDEHMGFCFYNNVAVATREMQRKGLAKKVLILDWDVHHGNGTQRAFYNDEDVLYISIHRHDGGRFYPTSDFGALDTVGEGHGEGKSVNIPWPTHGFGDSDYIYAFQKIVLPIAYEFNPDLVIISAGFDAADGDHLGLCNVTPAGYGHMTHMLSALAGGKLVVALEGGYNLRAISDSSLAVAQVLLGETPADIGIVEAQPMATEVMYEVAKVQSKYWKSIDVKACEPPEVGADADMSPITMVPEIVKNYRRNHLRNKWDLVELPLANEELQESYNGQVFANEGVINGDSDVLVLFVHDFGNLRVELDGVASTDISLDESYLIDTSDKVVSWAVNNNYNLIDVNILKQLPTSFARDRPRMVSNSGDKQDSQLMCYLWDNFIELSEAKHIVFVGHGTGCHAIMELVNHRDVEHRVKAVVQVAGLHSLVRVDPHNETRRKWFMASNRVYVPTTHPLLGEERLHRRLGGQIHTTKDAKVVDVLNAVFPQIREFVASKLPAQRVATANGTTPLEVASAVVAVA